MIGGQLVEYVGFPAIMRAIGLLNVVYTPMLLFLMKVSRPEDENGVEQEDTLGLDLEAAKARRDTIVKTIYI